jgi:hypothetical protein
LHLGTAATAGRHERGRHRGGFAAPLEGREDDVNELHLAVIVGGLLVVTVGLLLAGIRTIVANRSSKAAQAQSEIAVQRQVTESFTAAIDQLGYKNDLEVRLGAILAYPVNAHTH